jgi:hypothetical protein
LAEYKKKTNLKTLGSSRATAENRDGHTAYLTAEKLEVKIIVLADIGTDNSAKQRSAVRDVRKRGFSLKVHVLPEPIMLNMEIKGEIDKQKYIANEMLMLVVKIITLSDPSCMREV